MIPALLLALRVALPQDPAVLLVRVLDVSDARIGGDAILITDSSQGHARHVLIDASDRGRTVLAWLARFDVDTLAAVILSHAHQDHYGGMGDVLGRLPVGAFVYGNTRRTTVTYRALLRQIDALDVPVIAADSAPRRLTIATGRDSFELQLLPPPPGCRTLRSTQGADINNCSLGVRLVRDSFAMLFPGDAERAELQWWIETVPEWLVAPMLKAGHHGSSNATTAAWLDAVGAGTVIISANGRQHPFASVLRLLAARGAAVYCTADHGTITIRVPRRGEWEVRTERAGVCHARATP